MAYDASALDAQLCILVRNASDSFALSGTTAILCAEKPRGMIMQPSLSGPGTSTTASQMFAIADIEGVTRTAFNNDVDRWVSNTSGNPSSIVKLDIGLGDGSGTGGRTMRCRIDIQYFGYFFEPQTQGGS